MAVIFIIYYYYYFFFMKNNSFLSYWKARCTAFQYRL